MDKIAFMKAALAQNKTIEKPVPIVAFGDWRFYYTVGELEWRPNDEASDRLPDVKVPIWFVTDLASIPRVFWSVLSPMGRYSYPAIIHDFLYWFQTADRKQADTVFKLAMADTGVASVTATVIYEAVRIAGEGAWRTNASARRSGEKRVLREFPTDARVTWEEWKTKSNVFQ
jgi:Protein of unknown function (DUF1353)